AQAAPLGVSLTRDGVDWPAIRDRVFGRIDPISAGGEQWRNENEDVTLFRSEATFVGDHRIDTGTGEIITADRIVLAAGSRAVIPDWQGADPVKSHTADAAMRLDALPEHILIVGGGFISAEFAHIFSGLGSQATVVNRSTALLRDQDEEITTRFTA